MTQDTGEKNVFARKNVQGYKNPVRQSKYKKARQTPNAWTGLKMIGNLPTRWDAGKLGHVAKTVGWKLMETDMKK